MITVKSHEVLMSQSQRWYSRKHTMRTKFPRHIEEKTIRL